MDTKQHDWEVQLALRTEQRWLELPLTEQSNLSFHLDIVQKPLIVILTVLGWFVVMYVSKYSIPWKYNSSCLKTNDDRYLRLSLKLIFR